MARPFSYETSTLCALLCFSCGLTEGIQWRPVVLMHGLDAAAESMSHAQGWIEADFPGIYTRSIEIGNGKEDSLLFNMNKQVDIFAENVRKDPKLVHGFNVIGHSQGGLVIRGYVERYNDPPVFNMISWAGPQAGVYGVPDFNALCPDHTCPWLDELATHLSDGSWADKFVQEHFSFTNYWKPPLVCWVQNNLFLFSALSLTLTFSLTLCVCLCMCFILFPSLVLSYSLPLYLSYINTHTLPFSFSLPVLLPPSSSLSICVSVSVSVPQSLLLSLRVLVTLWVSVSVALPLCRSVSLPPQSEPISFSSFQNYSAYLEANIFLADINNERDVKNDTYKAHLSALNTYALCYSELDTIVIPRTSPWFQFYAIGSDTKVVEWNQTRSYLEDWIGLKLLQDSGKLVRWSVPCTHADIPRADCKAQSYDTITRNLLNNTLP
eukprot:m.427713 g.427713  ORF g.427713 m.427713 type:complete len:436 (+) comp21363_c1_seq21:296-1603(+)